MANNITFCVKKYTFLQKKIIQGLAKQSRRIAVKMRTSADEITRAVVRELQKQMTASVRRGSPWQHKTGGVFGGITRKFYLIYPIKSVGY